MGARRNKKVGAAARELPGDDELHCLHHRPDAVLRCGAAFWRGQNNLPVSPGAADPQTIVDLAGAPNVPRARVALCLSFLLEAGAVTRIRNEEGKGRPFIFARSKGKLRGG